jgi:hypothetical protein
LDLSPFAVDMAVKGAPSPRYLERIVEGRPMRPGRRVDFVVGDLYDGTVCPGPYDVVIECRTLQLFVRDGGQALQVVANRLSARAIFFSHAHDGGWRPPAPRKHLYEDWFSAQQWPRWSEDRPITQRVAWLSLSTG